MNKVIMMGRLTRDPEVRYGASGSAVATLDLAVDRRFKREGQPTADFFRCTAFGKTGEFVEKYLHKGTKVVIDGEVQNDNYTNKDGQMVYGTRIIINTIEFAESKNASQASGSDYSAPASAVPTSDAGDGFINIPEGVEEELPFK